MSNARVLGLPRTFVSAAVCVVGLAQAAFAEVELVQWQTNLRPPDIAGIESLVARYEELNPDVNIKIEATPWATHNQKILSAFNAGSGLPDIGRVGNIPQAAGIGFVQPLDDYIDDDWRAAIVPTAWADVTFSPNPAMEPHVWVVPKMLATEVWFYNRTMFEKAGLDPNNPPQTVEEFKRAAEALTRDLDGDGRIDQWGVGLTVAAEGGPYRQYTMAAQSFGGRLVAGPYSESTAGDEITWNSPETVAGMSWLKSLHDAGVTPPSAISDTVRDVANNFRAGKIGMVFMGPWEMAATREVFDANDWEWGLFRFPEGPGGRGEFMYVAGLGLFSQTPHVEEAVDYLKFYTSAEGLGLYMKTNGMIPANIEALADPYYSEDPYYSVFLNTIENADLVMPKWLQLSGADSMMNNTWTPLYQSMLEGSISVEDAVEQMHEALVEVVE